jgi:hypothetical protein
MLVGMVRLVVPLLQQMLAVEPRAVVLMVLVVLMVAPVLVLVARMMWALATSGYYLPILTRTRGSMCMQLRRSSGYHISALARAQRGEWC